MTLAVATLDPLREAPPREAVLTPEQLCAWLQISHRQLHRLDVPCIRLGRRTVRYSVEQVLEHLKRRAS